MFLFFVLAGEASWARSPGGSGTVQADHGIVLEVVKQHGRALRGSAHIPSVATGVRPHTKRSKIGDRVPVHVGTWYAFTAM
eukprot:COSAG02_NODE_1456_length_12512_cov_17.368082_6_plen_81_part_00